MVGRMRKCKVPKRKREGKRKKESEPKWARGVRGSSQLVVVFQRELTLWIAVCMWSGMGMKP